MFTNLIKPSDLPVYWRNEADGKLTPAVEAYFIPHGENKPIPEMSKRHIKLISIYLVKHLGAPVYRMNPGATAETNATLDALIKSARNLKNRADIDQLTDEMLGIGIDPF